jgi:hypothetical protein
VEIVILWLAIVATTVAYLEQATAQLYRLLHRDEHWAALAAIVDNLLAHVTLEGEEVEDIMRQWLREGESTER